MVVSLTHEVKGNNNRAGYANIKLMSGQKPKPKYKHTN